MYKVGDKIKIIHMRGEPKYANKIGEITHIARDFDNELYYIGTWGECHVYPFQDDIERAWKLV